MKKTILGIGAFVLVIGILLIVLPFIYVPKTVSESYQVPKSSVVADESFVVPAGIVTHTAYLNAGDSINIQVTVTSGGNNDLDFYLNDGVTTYLSYSRATTINKDWTAPLSSNYNFVYDNSFSLITSKDVTAQITKHWTETAFKDVTQNNQLLPFEFAYGGIVLVIAGIGLAVYGIVKRVISKPLVPPPPP